MRERIRTGPFLETLAVGVLPRIGAMGEMGKIGGAVAVGAKPRLSRRKCRFNFIHLSLEHVLLSEVPALHLPVSGPTRSRREVFGRQEVEQLDTPSDSEFK